MSRLEVRLLYSNQLPGITVPIIPGIIPIRSCSSLERIAELAGAYVPPSLNEGLKEICVSLLYIP